MTLYSDTYPAISPKNFSFKGEVALITGTYRSTKGTNYEALEEELDELPLLLLRRLERMSLYYPERNHSSRKQRQNARNMESKL